MQNSSTLYLLGLKAMKLEAGCPTTHAGVRRKIGDRWPIRGVDDCQQMRKASPEER
jgi:hypothetical protein